MTVHGFSRFAFNPISTRRRTFTICEECITLAVARIAEARGR
jgi:hypothetical protein